MNAFAIAVTKIDKWAAMIGIYGHEQHYCGCNDSKTESNKVDHLGSNCHFLGCGMNQTW